MDSSDTRFHTLQPLRDLESNWALDLAQNLEDYLLKICSGEITSPDDEHHFTVNFAEAALLLQGSIQVYSRKVEYLYNLVLHALEFVSQTRSQRQAESTPAHPEASSSCAVHDEDDQFWVYDEIAVDAKNCLDNDTSKDTSFDLFIKPPANLVVLEGECLDAAGDGELESYLLATINLYRDFLLLDPCDALSVDELLKIGKPGKGQQVGNGGSSLMSKVHKIFLSPAGRQSGGTARKSSAKKGQDICQVSPIVGDHVKFGPGPDFGNPDHGNCGYESDGHRSQDGDYSDSEADDDDDPWRPLNPHEPGNLNAKPFRKVSIPKRFGVMKSAVTSQYPLAKLHGTINPELTEIWEMQRCARKSQEQSDSPPLYEKLRNSLVHGGNTSNDTFVPSEEGDAECMFDDGASDFEPDPDMPQSNMDGVDTQSFKLDDFPDQLDVGSAEVNDDANSQASLEDLCRAHLDALLASVTESEKQTELVARVSTWKQRIEHDLEGEDSRPPFDIHDYGEVILEKLSLDEGENARSFTDVVKGHEKHDVARTFSALLQLVNDRMVDLDLDRTTSASDSFCHTSVNPFYIRLICHEKGPIKMQFRHTKKRQKSPVKEEIEKCEMVLLNEQPSVSSSRASGSKSKTNLVQPNCKFSRKMGKNCGLRCTPDGKRRRRSRLVDSVGFNKIT